MSTLTPETWKQVLAKKSKFQTEPLPLEIKNAHPRDKYIHFRDNDENGEKVHDYYLFDEDLVGTDKEHLLFDVAKDVCSVTSLNHKWFPESDSKAIVQATMHGKKWRTGVSPWIPYKTPVGVECGFGLEKFEASTKGTLMHAAIEIFINSLYGKIPERERKRLMFYRSQSSQKILTDKFASDRKIVQARAATDSRMYVNDQGDLVVPALAGSPSSPGGGGDGGSKSRKRKRTVDDDIEDGIDSVELSSQDECISMEPKSTDLVEFGYFLNFWSGLPALWESEGHHFDFEVYRTEWRIFDMQARIPGTIDCVLKVTPKEGSKVLKEWAGKTLLIILDWKRSKEIKMEADNYNSAKNGKGGSGVFENVDNTNYMHYSMQLNVYKYILEKHYKIDDKPTLVVGMFLGVFHPNKPDAEPYPIKDFQLLVSAAIREREAQLAKKSASTERCH